MKMFKFFMYIETVALSSSSSSGGKWQFAPRTYLHVLVQKMQSKFI